MLLHVDKAPTSKFSLRRRPTSEKLVDIGFKNIVITGIFHYIVYLGNPDLVSDPFCLHRIEGPTG